MAYHSEALRKTDQVSAREQCLDRLVNYELLPLLQFNHYPYYYVTQDRKLNKSNHRSSVVYKLRAYLHLSSSSWPEHLQQVDQDMTHLHAPAGSIQPSRAAALRRPTSRQEMVSLKIEERTHIGAEKLVYIVPLANQTPGNV